MFSTPKIFSQLFEGLSPRQREVVVGRFGLEGEGDIETLAALGDRYGVTRERVRQIEASALSCLMKKIKATPAAGELVKVAEKYLRSMGGVIKEENLLNQVRAASEGATRNHLNLLLEATQVFSYYPEDKDFWAFYYLDKNNLKKAVDFISRFVKLLRSKKEEVLGGAYNAHLARFVRRERVENKLVHNYLSISRKIHLNPYGDKGLAEWPEIKPRTIRDRIYLVLKKKGEPVHFEAIANLINEAGFGGRKALAPTVHNELIKDDRFVLVGRGIYGLMEHGYQPGTAKEVIERILRENGSLTFDALVANVQKKRFFKPNTILANLQRKDLFERLENGAYRVREA